MSFRKSTLAVPVVIIALLLAASDVYTHTNQPPVSKTNAPSETTCNSSGCHNNTLNSGPGNVAITFSGTELKYVPGQTYDMTVTTKDSDKVRFGFEITSLDANDDSVGKFIIPNGTTNLVALTNVGLKRKYLGHKSANSINSWSFQWKAPAINKGDLTFYAAGNGANGDGHSSGDHIYTSSLTIAPDNSAGVFSPNDASGFFEIQSLSSGLLTLQFNRPSQNVQLNILDLNGRLIKVLMNDQVQNEVRSFTLPVNLTTGIYLIQYKTSEISTSQKIFIQR